MLKFVFVEAGRVECLVWKGGKVGLGLCTRSVSWRTSVRSSYHDTTMRNSIISSRDLATVELIAIDKVNFDSGARRRVEGPWTFVTAN